MEDKNAHIPTSEIEDDIKDTLREIRRLEDAIVEREAFVRKLRGILYARGNAEASSDSEAGR